MHHVDPHRSAAHPRAGIIRRAALVIAIVVLAACGDDTDDLTDADQEETTPSTAEATTTSSTAAPDAATTTEAAAAEPAADEDDADPSEPGACDDIAALFVTRGSANPDLDDPEVSASCDGDTITVASNGIPDYTYIETSPGQPTDRGHTFTLPAIPTVADTTTAIPYLGSIGVTLGGIPIFGPTEGTGGDVESLPGILSACGSHNGPSGFHIHLILSSSETDCLFTPEEVAEAPQLVGYAFDGFPIYTGIDHYTSSWELTDETLFATDTWAAHSYVEGSGDLDECNGRTDENGDYAYYTTATFPYLMGCYAGVVELEAPGGGGAAPDGERPERPEGEERPERPEAPVDGEEVPERPEVEGAPPEDGDSE